MLCDYFRATGSETAMAQAFGSGGLSAAADSDVVDLKNVDPFVLLAALLKCLEASVPEPRLIGSREDEVLLVELDDHARDVLADADTETVERAVRCWAQTPELNDRTSFGDLLPAAANLVALARRALAAGDSLYCLMCL